MTSGSGGKGPGHSLAARFAGAWIDLRDRVGGQSGEPVVVALGGGVDSMVLLHLMRFGLPASERPRLIAAYLDHQVRGDEGGDARWLAGVCRAWGVEFHPGRLAMRPAGEGEARTRRYAFLHEVRQAVGASWIVTGHHRDDQAETVLFRALRGAGPGGLVGIHEIRDDGVLRPLLSFSRQELVSHARGVGIGWREDPTNLDLTNPRNWIRHELLPALEARVAPGASASLARLAGLAARDEEAWDMFLAGILEECLVPTVGTSGAHCIDRDTLGSYHPGVQARVLRELSRRLGAHLDSAGTQAGLEFISAGASGRTAPLGRGLELARDFDRLVLSRRDGEGEGVGYLEDLAPCVIPGPGGDEGAVGRRRVVWGEAADSDPELERMAWPLSQLCFPLTLRPWRPGDRLRLPYGTKKVKKLLAEARVGASNRSRALVLSDASGEIFWVVGVASVAPDAEEEDGAVFHIGVERDPEQ